MAKGLTIGRKLFGKNDSENLWMNFIKEDLNKSEAEEIIDSIEHSGTKEVINYLKTQITKGSQIIHYNFMTSSHPDTILFSDWAYRVNLASSFNNVLRKAFPDYKVPNSQPIGEIIMNRIS